MSRWHFLALAVLAASPLEAQDTTMIAKPKTTTTLALGDAVAAARQNNPDYRIAQNQVDPAKAQLSFICYDLSDLSNYTKSISTPLYRMLKTYLPGPYTFILPASKQVPKILKSRKDTIGLRVPDNVIARSLVKELGHPILSSSLPGEMVEEYTDPEMILDKFEQLVDIVVDGGIGGIIPSTVIDCTGEGPQIIRKGLGEWEVEAD